MRTARSLFLSSLMALLSCAPAPTIDEMVADLSRGMESPLPVVALGAAPPPAATPYPKCPFCKASLETEEAAIRGHFLPHYRTPVYKAFNVDVGTYVASVEEVARSLRRWKEDWKLHEAKAAQVGIELKEFPGGLAAWKQEASKTAARMREFDERYKGKPETAESKALFGRLRDEWASLKKWKAVLDRQEALVPERRKLDEDRDRLSARFQELETSYRLVSAKISSFRSPFLISHEKLTSVAESMVKDARYKKESAETKCNVFLSDLAVTAFGYEGFKNRKGEPLLANEIVDLIRGKEGGWKCLHDPDEGTNLVEGFKKAQELANRGHLVVVGCKNADGAHGHVAVVVPGKLGTSTEWDIERAVPQIAQAGESVFSGDKLSWGFRSSLKDKIVVYFLNP